MIQTDEHLRRGRWRWTNRRIFGCLLFLVIALFAAGFQWLGPGLITSEQPAPQRTAIIQGTVVTQITSYHHLLVPLIILAGTALWLAIVPGRSDRRPERDNPPVACVLAALLALFGLLFGRLTGYAPGGAGAIGALMALSSCTFGLILAVAALIRHERLIWLSALAILLSLGGSLPFFLR